MESAGIALLIALVGFLTGAGLVAFVLWGVVQKWRRLDERHTEIESRRRGVESEREKLDASRLRIESEREQFQARKVSYDELASENRILKGDLRNIDVTLRKLELDGKTRDTELAEIDQRSQALAERYLRDVEKWVSSSLNANNFTQCKQRLTKAIEWARGVGYDYPAEREAELIDELRSDFERAVRAQVEREEQARIKAQIREEQAREREIQRELKNLEREREAIAAALAKALAEAKEEHSEEVERLRARLADAENRQRAVSQAQLTRAGHIYVISNVGSFGDGMYKIGMTRRLEPMDRVKELGDASVPFPFDVHMMISCDDAPTLEADLHRMFHEHRVNKINPRKEYFRVDLDTVYKFVTDHHGEVNYVADAEALEYRQSLGMTAEDQDVIDAAYAKADAELGVSPSE